MMRPHPALAAVLLLAAGSSGSSQDSLGREAGIAWYSTWEQGIRVARSTGRPILLLAAAPHCHGISGLW